MIDHHLHINYNVITNDNFIDYLDRNKFEKAWVLTWDEIESSDKKWNYQNLKKEDVIELYEKYPDKVVPFYAPDPLRDNALELFIDSQKRGIKGYGELKSTIKWNDKRLDKILEYLNQNSLTLIFHIEDSCFRLKQFDNETSFGKLLNKIFHSKIIKFFTEPSFYFIYNFIYKKTTLYKSTFNNKTSQKIKTNNNSNSIINDILNKKYKKIKSIFSVFFNNTIYFFSIILKKLLFLYEFPGYMLDFNGLEDRLKQFPDIKFIAHGPFWWANISTNQLYRKYPKGKIKEEGLIFRLLREYKNLYCDLSGLSAYNALKRNVEFTKIFTTEFKDKLLFGTDNYEKSTINFYI